MGWIHGQHPGHEGYVVGLTRTHEERWRDLEYGDPPTSRVLAVQVACDCGWRSPRLFTPLSTTWFPVMVRCQPEFENDLRKLWNEHVLATEANSFCRKWKATP